MGNDGNIQQTGHYEAIGQERSSRTSRGKTVLKRLAILAVFGLILAGGVLARIYIKVEPHAKWRTLCIPVNESHITTTPESLSAEDNPFFVLNNEVNHVSLYYRPTVEPLPENVTLPFCNTTRHNSNPSALYSPWWSRHVDNDMRMY